MNITVPPTIVNTPLEAVGFLAATSGLSKTKVKDAMTKGAVWLQPPKGKQRRLRRATHQLNAGDTIAMYYSTAILETQPSTPTLIEDTRDYSVWIKPSGLMSGGSRFGDHCAIDRVVEKRLDRPTFLVHRLDRFVWGIMLLAHTRSAAANLSDQFQSRATEKVYRAIVHGELQDSQSIDQAIDGRDALTYVEPISSVNGSTLVEVKIETGRKHQIRVHLSAIGHPIIGDRQYGSEDKSGIQLAATRLGFHHPTSGERVTYTLPPEQEPTLRFSNQEAK